MPLSNTFFLILTLIGLSCALDVPNCAIPINYTLFNLCEFKKVPSFNIDDTNGALSFSLGSPHIKSCHDQEEIWGTYTNALKECIDIAAQNPNYTLLDPNNPEAGLSVNFPIENDPITLQSYQLIVHLECDHDQKEANETHFQVEASLPHLPNQLTRIILKGSSSHGCPVVSFNQLIDFLFRHREVFAVIGVVIGLFLILFGLWLFKTTVFIISIVVGSLLVGTLFFEFTDLGTEKWIQWTIFTVSVIFGLVLGYLSLKFEKLAYFAIGIALGSVLGLIIYNAFILPFEEKAGGLISLYLTLGICALIAGGLSICLLKSIVILATSVIGAYMVVRSISIFLGGFPTETYVIQGIEEFDPVVYAYLIAVVLLSILGIYYQSKGKKREIKEETTTIASTKGPYYRY